LKDLENLYSYHHFMFPFRFDKIIESFEDKHEFYKKYEFDERVNLETINVSLEKDGWEYQKFSVKNHLNYNELVYFYDFVKDSLFNTSEFQTNATSYYFDKQNIQDQYKIVIKNKTYSLKLTGVTLRIFDVGVAILAFEVENHKYDSLEDIFNINEYGRRSYPQFLSDGFSKEKVQEAFLPLSLEVNGFKEDFEQENYDEIQIANFILQTLGDTFTTKKIEKGKNYIQPLLDDRMFVVSHLFDDDFSNSIKEKYDDKWYQYVFVDKINNKMVQNSEMQKKLIDQSTYNRWQNYGTLFGVTRYSFVVLTNKGDLLKDDFSKKILFNHTKTLYFQMVTLSLATRATILRFSDEITALSDIQNGDKEISKKIAQLYKNYLRFKNKLYFKEITPQEQGIELYDKMRGVMRIDSDIADLSHEIASLNSYAYFVDEREEKEQMNKLTKLGTYFLPPSLIAGIFGMNVFGSKSMDIESYKWILIAFLIGIVSPIVVNLFVDKERKI